VVRGGVQAISEKKSIAKIVSDTERMKSTPIYVCAKTTFVGSPSIASRRISSFHNFLSFNGYFRKYFKFTYRKNVVMVTLTTGVMFLLFTCMHFWLRAVLEIKIWKCRYTS
jgi:hypothetical protein